MERFLLVVYRLNFAATCLMIEFRCLHRERRVLRLTLQGELHGN